MSKKHNKFYKVLNLLSTCFNFYSYQMCFHFYFCFSIPTKITSPVIGLKICIITAGIKKYKTIIKRKNKRNDETVLLAKSQLSSIEVLIFKAWIDSNISLDKFVLINNVLKEFYDI